MGSQERQSVVHKVGRSLGIVAAEDIQGGWGEEPETVVVVEIEKVLEGRVLGETCSVSLKSANCPSCHSHVCNKEKKTHCMGFVDHQKEGNGNLYTVLRIQNRSVSLHPKYFIT